MKTYEEDRSTALLIKETKSFKILGREAETRLFKEYHSIKDEKRRQEIKAAIIQSNLRFCLALARAYKKQTGIPIGDFYAEGKLGMLEAFNKFDYTQGVKFGSFAVFELRRHMKMLVNNSDNVRVPVKIRNAVIEAKRKGTSVEKFKYGVYASNAISDAMSFDTPVGTDNATNNFTIGDTLSAEDRTDQEHEESLIKENLKEFMEDNLSAEENNLLRRLYGLDGYEDTVSEIASERKISKEYIRRVRSRALAKLRGLPEVAELRASCRS